MLEMLKLDLRALEPDWMGPGIPLFVRRYHGRRASVVLNAPRRRDEIHIKIDAAGARELAAALLAHADHLEPPAKDA